MDFFIFATPNGKIEVKILFNRFGEMGERLKPPVC